MAQPTKTTTNNSEYSGQKYIQAAGRNFSNSKYVSVSQNYGAKFEYFHLCISLMGCGIKFYKLFSILRVETDKKFVSNGVTNSRLNDQNHHDHKCN